MNLNSQQLETTIPLFSKHPNQRLLHDVKCNMVLLSKFFLMILTCTHQVSWLKMKKYCRHWKAKCWPLEALNCLVTYWHPPFALQQNAKCFKLMEFCIWISGNHANLNLAELGVLKAALKFLANYLGPLYSRSHYWNRKKLFNLPQVTNKHWTLWACIGPKAGKRIPSNLGGQFVTLGPNVPAFINMLTSMF